MRNHGQRKRKIESGDNFSFLFLPIFKTNEQTNILRIKRIPPHPTFPNTYSGLPEPSPFIRYLPGIRSAKEQ